MAFHLDNDDEVIEIHSDTGSGTARRLNSSELNELRGAIHLLRDRVRGFVNVMAYIPANLRAGVKDGTNTADLAPYLQAAIDASFTEGHLRVAFPGGTYRIESSLRCYPASYTGLKRGVHLVGAGRYETFIDVYADTSTDGLVYSHTEPYGYGGSVEGMTIRGGGEDPTKMRDGISFLNWTSACLRETDSQYSGRNGLRLIGSMDLYASRIYIQRSAGDGIYTGGEGVTTLDFDRVYVLSAGENGMSLRGTTISCHACVIERSGENGVTTPERGHGILLRHGHVNVTGNSHFEANLGHDIYIHGNLALEGEEVTGTTFQIDHSLYDFGGRKAAGYNGVRVSTCNGGTLVVGNVTGSSESNLAWAIDGATSAKNVRVILGTNQTSGFGGTPVSYTLPLPQMAGIFEYYDAATTAIVQTGQFRTEPGLGVVLTSPNGTRYLVKVADGGALSTEALA